MDTIKRRDLNELGTRYEHWQELRDLFLTGIAAREKMHKSYWTERDFFEYGRLIVGAELIARQIEIAGRHEIVSYLTTKQVEDACHAVKKHIDTKAGGEAPKHQAEDGEGPFEGRDKV